MRRITKLPFGSMPSTNSIRRNMSRKSVRTIGVTLVIAISLLVGIALQPTGRTSAQTTAQAAILGRGEIRGLSLSADGKRLAGATTVGEWVYNAASLKDAPRLYETQYDILNALFSPDGKTLAASGS